MKTYCLFLFACSMLLSCKKNLGKDSNQSASNNYTVYLIRQGNHYADGNSFKLLNQPDLRFYAWFDSSCIYTTVNAANATDINKLYGFSDCNSGHQENSARLGWRWNGKAIDILAYCYINSIRQYQLIGSIGIGEKVKMAIKPLKDKYQFEINGNIVLMNRSCNTDHIEGYQLYPYFGGDETAPHDIRVYIEDIK